MGQVRVKEIFYSIQGESGSLGMPTTFVRLSGCPLRCTYCDSAYAFVGGRLMGVAQILEDVAQYPTRLVTVTGGEPLAQPDCLGLLVTLCDQGFSVSLETSGALTVASVDKRVRKVVDFKTPASGEVGKNLWDNVAHLEAKDEVKFVVADRGDFDWALEQVGKYDLASRVDTLWFSPVYERLAPAVLADWVLSCGIPVRLQLQLHKLLWGDLPGR